MAEEMIYDANGNATGFTQDPQVVAAAEAAASNVTSLKNDFIAALNVSFWEGMTSTPQEILANRTPDQVFDAFATAQPDWAETINTIKADPELRDSFYNAITKDPTMLDGLASMAADGAGVNPQEMLAAINDPLSRQALTATLNKIAEKPDDGIDFADFQYLYENRNDRVKALAKLREIGVTPGDMMGAVDGEQVMSMLRNALMSPTGFRDLFNQLPEMLGLTGEQAEAAREAMGMFGNYLDLCLGTKEDGLRSLAVEYGDDLVAGGTDYFERISGQRDTDLAAQRAEAGQGEAVDPATAGVGSNPSLVGAYADPAAGRIPAADQTTRYDQQVASWSAPRDRSPDLTPNGM